MVVYMVSLGDYIDVDAVGWHEEFLVGVLGDDALRELFW